MRLSKLIGTLKLPPIDGADDIEVTAITEDSRRAGPGVVFCAVRGMRSDGHDFIEAAIASGACAIVAEHRVDAAVPVLVVANSAQALGIASGALADSPADNLRLVGITGTNGKTTCSYLIESMLAAAGRRPGVIGTVNYRFAGQSKEAPYTTPTPAILHAQLGEFVAAGCDDAVLEVSSAALMMERLAGLHFAVGVFTNLTQDHLDLHDDMDGYETAKTRLFSERLSEDGTAVIFADDPAADRMRAAAGSHRVLRVSIRPNADVEIAVREYQSTMAGIRAVIDTPRGPLELRSRALVGGYNVANLATCVGVGEALGLEHEAIARGIADMPGVPGRVERVDNDRDLDILVDYAHTPDALANVLRALRPLTERRLLCVFGCGGDRDPSKRPRMGAEVAELADLAFVTSDNPRTEDPRAIIEQILPAVPDAHFVDVDRRTAIAAAVAEATPGDVVLIAGKGHEDYQILGTEKIHFDDREEAASAAAARPRFEAARVADVTGAALTSGAPETQFERVVIDGRATASGDLYVAIVGERFDGHDFVAQAAEAGALGAIVRPGTPSPAQGFCLLEHDDPREALGRLAGEHRLRWGRSVVGITGSTGKTTVKDLTAAALAPLGRVHRPLGSLNNETGVPLTLLGLRDYHQAAVIEMGMRGLGHIDYLAELARPDVAVVVNAQVAHIGVVGSAEDIARGKSEIYRHIRPKGCAIAPADDERLLAVARSAPRLITFGRTPEADVQVVGYRADGSGHSHVELAFSGEKRATEIPFVGRHNAENAACAIAAAIASGVEFAEAMEALSRAKPSAMRGQLVHIGGRNVLVDCYNANPVSMTAAMTTLQELGQGQRMVAVLGDMLELGDLAVEEHVTVGGAAAAMGARLISLGEHADDMATAARSAGGEADVADTPELAARLAWESSSPGDWILIKASRGMRLERVANGLRALADKEPG